MGVKCHFQIQSNKLRQVTMGVAVLGSENGPNRKDPLKVTRNGHLLVKLGTLGKVGRVLKVGNRKDVCPTLTRRRNDFRSMNLHKVLQKLQEIDKLIGY